MKRFALALAVLFGSLTCGPEAAMIARADRPHDTSAGKTPPNKSASARAWQASYAAEAAGNFQEALDSLADLPPPQRETYLANYRRGWLLYRLGKHAESAAAYAAASALEPASIEARVAMLVPLIALSKWADVVTVAQEVLKRDPENYLAMQRFAFAKFSTQHFPEAELLYRHLIKLYPSDIELRASLAWAVLRNGKLKEAAELFNSVLEISPNHASAAAGLKEATANTPAKP
jgi:protein O-GlcNAc transferase